MCFYLENGCFSIWLLSKPWGGKPSIRADSGWCFYSSTLWRGLSPSCSNIYTIMGQWWVYLLVGLETLEKYWKTENKHICIHGYIIYCTTETNTTLESNYTPMKKKECLSVYSTWVWVVLSMKHEDFCICVNNHHGRVTYTQVIKWLGPVLVDTGSFCIQKITTRIEEHGERDEVMQSSSPGTHSLKLI